MFTDFVLTSHADKAFRHGDIENILETLAKTVGGGGGGAGAMAAALTGGGLLGFAKTVLKQASGGSNFSKSDVKKVYFVSASGSVG